MTSPLLETRLTGLRLSHRGKVRDLYALDSDLLLIVATDRISAFDCVLPDPIPDKGRVLTALSNFWFDRFAALIPNHRVELSLAALVTDPAEREPLIGRTVVARRLRPLPIEAVVRGYLIGSGWKDYQRTGALCGIALPPGLRLAERLPSPLFTPSTKAAIGDHDENIDFDTVRRLLGDQLAERVRDLSLRLYSEAAEYALQRGLLIADTKFEFGLDAGGELYLIDEVLTPDSSRFWPEAAYRVGVSPPSFDKQYVRDYLEQIGWNKRPPAPHLPTEIIARTSEKYREAERRLIGHATPNRAADR